MRGDPRDGGDLVILARCADTIEASSLRMFLDSRGLYCLVQGEHHAAGGGFGDVPEVAVLVREADLDEASRLLELFQQGTPAVEEENEQPAEAPRPAGKPAKRTRPDEGRRYTKRIGVVIIVSLSLTFGCGHFYVGARKRGLGLLVLELISGVAMFGGEEWGGAMVLACMLTDMIGASLLIVRQRAEHAGGAPASKWPGRVFLALAALALLVAGGSVVSRFLAERRHDQLSRELAQVQLRCERGALWLENTAPVAQQLGVPRVAMRSPLGLHVSLFFDTGPSEAPEEWPVGLSSPGPWTLAPGARLKLPYSPPKAGPCAGRELFALDALGGSCSTLSARLQRLDEASGAVEVSAERSCRLE